MTGFVDGVFPGVAQDLMRGFGRSTTFVIPSSTPIDPAQPFLGNEDTTTEIDAFAVWKRFNRPQGTSEVYEITDVAVLVAAADLGDNVPPDDSWQVIDGNTSKKYSVVTVGEVAPGPDRVLYELVLRG